MSGTMPGRVTAVFAVLVFATCVTWWLGSESSLTAAGFELAATVTLLIAFMKIALIGLDFMELRAAHAILRAAFLVWVGVFAASAIMMVVV